MEIAGHSGVGGWAVRKGGPHSGNRNLVSDPEGVVEADGAGVGSCCEAAEIGSSFAAAAAAGSPAVVVAAGILGCTLAVADDPAAAADDFDNEEVAAAVVVVGTLDQDFDDGIAVAVAAAAREVCFVADVAAVRFHSVPPAGMDSVLDTVF